MRYRLTFRMDAEIEPHRARLGSNDGWHHLYERQHVLELDPQAEPDEFWQAIERAVAEQRMLRLQRCPGPFSCPQANSPAGCECLGPGGEREGST